MSTGHLSVSNSPRIFRFADLELDEGRQRVLRDGKEVPLPKLSFDLLLVLAESAPNFLSNRELMARVWPGLVIADKTVSQRVKLLRDALGDDREEPHYITGLRGRGYCIAATVTRVDRSRHTAIGDSAPTQAGKPLMPARPQTKKLMGWLVTVGLLVALVVSLWWTPGPAGRNANTGIVASNELTVAVLPFRELGGNGSDAYLALGVPEMVLDQLSSVAGLSVIARSSSFKVLRNDADVRKTGQRLGARYLVDGSIQKSGERLRVSAQLIDASTGKQIWAERFDRGISEIFAIQDQIAARVTDALRARIADLQPAATHKRPTENIDAYLAYLRGRAMLARWTVVDADSATAAFERAIDLDPNFAAAYAALYDARLMAEDRRSGGATPNRVQSEAHGDGSAFAGAKARNQSLIDQALTLDPASGAAYFARAIWADNATDTREADFRRGLELDPSNGRGITAFAEFLDRSGQHAEAERLLERAIRIDPLSPRAYFWRVMRVFPSDPGIIEAGMLGVLEIDPDYLPALQRYAKYRWMIHGELAQAIQLIERALALDPTNPWIVHTAVAMYLDIGNADSANALQAGSARPDVSGRLLLLLYERDTRGAGEAAFDESAFANGPYENWGVYEAILGWSLESADYARALAYLDQHSALAGEDGEITIENFRAVPAYAQIEMAAGKTALARTLLTKCILWIDDYHVPRISKVYALRVKANAQLLLGETDHALATLRESFEAQDYLQWWYTLERDPLWLPLHGEPRFEAINAEVRRHVDDQRQRLNDLRQQNLVPRRPSKIAVVGSGH